MPGGSPQPSTSFIETKLYRFLCPGSGPVCSFWGKTGRQNAIPVAGRDPCEPGALNRGNELVCHPGKKWYSPYGSEALTCTEKYGGTGVSNLLLCLFRAGV